MSIKKKWYAEIPDEVRDTLFKIRVKIGPSKILEHNFLPDVDVDYDELEAQLEEIPAKYAYVSSILAEQKAIVQMKERMLLRRKALVTDEILQSSREAGISLRVSDVEKLIEKDDVVTKFDADLIMSRKVENKLIGLVTSIRMKSDSLRSLAGFKRQEMSDP